MQGTERLRAAIVGTGSIARAHARALRADGRADLVAGVDVDDGRLAGFSDEWGVAGRYGSVAAMLSQERPDLVHICTPPGAHTDAAVASLHAGAVVICEKPPCLTLADFDRIAAAERAGGTPFVTIFQHRFGTAARYLRELIETDCLGQPLVAICHTLWYRGQSYYEPDWRGRWASEGGGPTMGHGVHQIDLLAHLLGDWTEIVATAGRLARDVETEDVSFAHVTFANGAIASIVNSVLSPREESYLRFDFSDATVELTHLYGYGAENWRYTPRSGAVPINWPAPAPDVRSSHVAQISDVLDSLVGGHRPAPSSTSARRTMEIITGIYASAFTGNRVRRDELVPGYPFYDRLSGDLAAIGGAG